MPVSKAKTDVNSERLGRRRGFECSNQKSEITTTRFCFLAYMHPHRCNPETDMQRRRNNRNIFLPFLESKHNLTERRPTRSRYPMFLEPAGIVGPRVQCRWWGGVCLCAYDTCRWCWMFLASFAGVSRWCLCCWTRHNQRCFEYALLVVEMHNVGDTRYHTR